MKVIKFVRFSLKMLRCRAIESFRIVRLALVGHFLFLQGPEKLRAYVGSMIRVGEGAM